MNSHAFQPTPEYQVGAHIFRTPIAGLWFLEHKHFADHRGYYDEIARVPEIEEQTGKSFNLRQLNLSHSQTNVIRGIHAESWNKLVTVTNGTIFGAWVDLRPTSPTFSQVVTMRMGWGADAISGSLFISSGIGNSFVVTQGPVDYVYAVDALYSERDPNGDIAVSVFDPDLKIAWPVARPDLNISQRDLDAITMREKFPDYHWNDGE